MLNRDAKFGQFKAKVSEQLGKKDVKKLSAYYTFSAKVRGEIEDAKNPGLALLNELEKENIIGADSGVDDLCSALAFCGFHKAKKDAQKHYEESRKSEAVDLPDCPGYTDKDLRNLRSTIRGQITKQNCVELATCLGLDACTIEKIEDSRDPDDALIQSLHDAHIITETQIGYLLFALETCHLVRVASLITRGRGGGTTPANQSMKSGGSRLSESFEVQLAHCVCSDADFEEFSSSGSEVVSLQCQKCSAEWLPGSGKVSLVRNEKVFAYKVPLKFDVSLLERKPVKELKGLKPGDHVVFERWRGMYDHHAILVLTKPDDRKLDVFHWTSDTVAIVKKALHLGKAKPITIEHELVEFPKEGVKRIEYNQPIDPAHLVIARAWRMSQKPDQVYSVTDNNCETFATYCKIGKCLSHQGRVVKDILPPMMQWYVSYFAR